MSHFHEQNHCRLKNKGVNFGNEYFFPKKLKIHCTFDYMFIRTAQENILDYQRIAIAEKFSEQLILLFLVCFSKRKKKYH